MTRKVTRTRRSKIAKEAHELLIIGIFSVIVATPYLFGFSDVSADARTTFRLVGTVFMIIGWLMMLKSWLYLYCYIRKGERRR